MLNNPKYKDWINVNGDIRGYVVELNKNVSKIKEINEIVGANLKPIGGTENRVVVNGKQLTKLEEAELADSGILTSYKIPEIEFEKYLVEGQKRQFRLQNTDQMPVFEQYTSPGGSNYTELVFKIKNKEGTTPAILEGEFGTLANNKVKSEVKTSINYNSPHFGNNWYEFTIKRLTRYAADNGFDAIAIPKGELAANRYGQNTFKAKRIRIEPDIDDATLEPASDNFELLWYNDKNEVVKSIRMNADDDYFFENLKKYEKEISGNFAEFQEKVMEATSEYKALDFDFPAEATLGSGAGKFRLYDQTIPGYMKKYAKKWNAKVYDDNINIIPGTIPENMPVTILELSDEMKTGVQSSSQPLFELLGGVSLSYWGAQAVSDSMENNIISQTTN